MWGPSWFWSWSYGSWVYNSLCNQCLSTLNLWVWIPLMAKWIQYIMLKVCHGPATGLWFSPPIKLTTHITEILLKVALYKYHNPNPNQFLRFSKTTKIKIQLYHWLFPEESETTNSRTPAVMHFVGITKFSINEKK